HRPRRAAHCPTRRSSDLAGAGLDEIEAILTESDNTRIHFDEGGVAWGGRRADVDDVVRLRARGATTFGSCSFTEPVEELQALGVDRKSTRLNSSHVQISY